ncbi:RNA polymerase sigma factor [Methylosinus sp. Sm6]|uniref:RNA polymerase sigma factor n=1 Tax=Methylosinus sp. Sm6 TaxID=2866948 RepID=UPI001C99104D|nr:RNA polymerase sigma factor [Methylosinus sp. Sm6]MBY6243807.1 RNA polymerase sigma factor [Methylosinus sp. Sm6]
MFSREQSAIGDLFERHRRELLAYLTRKIGQADAPDLLQETFARFIARVDAEAVAEPPPFLQKIAMNLARDFARAQAAEAKLFDIGAVGADAPSPGLSPLAQLEATQQWRLVLAAILALPPRCREVFVLYMNDGLDLGEIAARLGMSRNMAQKHMRMALARCWAALE